MKYTKLTLVITVMLIAAMLFSGCNAALVPSADPTPAPVDETEPFSDDYAIASVTLCGTDTNNADYMKGFSMQGTIGELLTNTDIFSVAMCYTTGNIDDVKAFFTSERFSDPASFLAEVDALDLSGNVRNLSGDRLAYLDGNTGDPIKFYGDGIDLLNDVSLLTTAGEYHFYLVTMGYEKVLWVGEADRTFVMEQSAIDLAASFASAFEMVVESRIMTDVADPAALTQDEKTQGVADYFQSQIDALGLGITVSAIYENDESYPDDYLVTLEKDGVTSEAYVTVFFGAELDPSAELFAVNLVRADNTNTEFELMKGFQLGFHANGELVTADNTKGYIMFFSTGTLEEVTAAFEGKVYDDMLALDTDGKLKLIEDLTYADGAGNTFYSDGTDLLGDGTPIATPGEYHFYAATLDMDGAVRYIAEAATTFVCEG